MESTNSVPPDLRAQVSRALAPEEEYYAEVVADPGASVEVFPAQFLSRYCVYRVERRGRYKPTLFYVGFAPGGSAYLLTGKPDNFARMCKADRVVIDSPEAAARYAAVYLEATRSMSELFYLVGSADEVLFRPNLTEEAEAVKAAFIKKYRNVIRPPSARAQASGYEVLAYAVREQALERHKLLVSGGGEAEDEVVVIERDLPLVYGG